MKLDLTVDELLVLPAVDRPVGHLCRNLRSSWCPAIHFGFPLLFNHREEGGRRVAKISQFRRIWRGGHVQGLFSPPRKMFASERKIQCRPQLRREPNRLLGSWLTRAGHTLLHPAAPIPVSSVRVRIVG